MEYIQEQDQNVWGEVVLSVGIQYQVSLVTPCEVFSSSEFLT